MRLARHGGWRGRREIAARSLAATAGAYAVASSLAMAAAFWLPLPPAEAALCGAMAALLAAPLAAMGCFWARSAARAWTWIGLGGGLLAACAWAGGWRP